MTLPYRQLIHESVIRGLQVVLAARKKMEIPFEVEGEDLEQHADMALLFKSYESINPDNIGDLAVLAKRLWNDPGVKETFRRRFVKAAKRLLVICIVVVALLS